MSAGVFTDSRYKSDDNLVFPVRVQPETLQLVLDTATNTATSDDVGAGLPTLVTRKSRKGFGVHPRFVTIKLTADGAGAKADYKEGTQHRVPILQKAMWQSLVKGDVGTYLGIACEVVSKTPELLR